MDVTIINSVGENGKNHKADTRKIQKLLNAIFASNPLKTNGDCGPKTIQRIRCFQKRFLAQPDGLVDPDGRILRKLNAAAAAPDMQKDWCGNSSHWSEEKKLSSLNEYMRLKVVLVLADLKCQGFNPRIFYAWCSVAVQQKMVAEGTSKLRFSFHNALKKDVTPNAYAVDIIDKRWYWEDSAEKCGFWQALGAAGKKQGLCWGGDWCAFPDQAHLQFFPNSKLSDVEKESFCDL